MNKILYFIVFIFLGIFSCFDYKNEKQDLFNKTGAFINLEDEQENEDIIYHSLPTLNADSGIDLSEFEFIKPVILKQQLKSMAEIEKKEGTNLQSTSSFDCKTQEFFMNGLGCIDAKDFLETTHTINSDVVNCCVADCTRGKP